MESERRKLGHVPALDGIRGIAILLVIFFHAGLLSWGWSGVQLFFVLSGFLITHRLLESRHLGGVRYFKQFYFRRILRIFPLFYTYLGFVALCWYFWGIPALFRDDGGWLLTYLYNWVERMPGPGSHSLEPAFYTHFWSLCIEEQYYLFWPMIIIALSPRKSRRLTLLILVAVPVYRWGLGQVNLQNGQIIFERSQQIYRSTFTQLDGFALGGWLAIGNYLGQRGICRQYFTALLIFLMGLCLWCGFGDREILTHGLRLPYELVTAGGEHIWAFSMFNLLSGGLILGALHSPLLARSLSPAWLRYLGKISYGLYVYHLLINQYFLLSLPADCSNGRFVASFSLYLAALILLASLSFYTMESYFLRMKKKSPENPEMG